MFLNLKSFQVALFETKYPEYKFWVEQSVWIQTQTCILLKFCSNKNNHQFGETNCYYNDLPCWEVGSNILICSAYFFWEYNWANADFRYPSAHMPLLWSHHWNPWLVSICLVSDIETTIIQTKKSNVLGSKVRFGLNCIPKRHRPNKLGNYFPPPKKGAANTSLLVSPNWICRTA